MSSPQRKVCGLPFVVVARRACTFSGSAKKGRCPGVAVGLLFGRWVVSDSLWPQGPQHARLPCPSPSPGACSNSSPLSRWCPAAISPSVAAFSPALGPSRRQGHSQCCGVDATKCACAAACVLRVPSLFLKLFRWADGKETVGGSIDSDAGQTGPAATSVAVFLFSAAQGVGPCLPLPSSSNQSVPEHSEAFRSNRVLYPKLSRVKWLCSLTLR